MSDVLHHVGTEGGKAVAPLMSGRGVKHAIALFLADVLGQKLARTIGDGGGIGNPCKTGQIVSGRTPNAQMPSEAALARQTGSIMLGVMAPAVGFEPTTN